MEKILYLRSDKTVLRRDDKIVKIFSGSYSKADVLNEALNQARAEETNLNVPTVYEVTKADGKWAIVSQYIEGKTLRAMMEENPRKTGGISRLFYRSADGHSRGEMPAADPHAG